MESTNELVTAAEARAEGLSLDGVANNRCITKQQFNDNLPSGGGYCCRYRFIKRFTKRQHPNIL